MESDKLSADLLHDHPIDPKGLQKDRIPSATTTHPIVANRDVCFHRSDKNDDERKTP